MYCPEVSRVICTYHDIRHDGIAGVESLAVRCGYDTEGSVFALVDILLCNGLFGERKGLGRCCD